VASLHSLLKSSFFLHWISPAQFLSWSLRSTHLSERSGKVQQRLVVLRTSWDPVLVLSSDWLRRKQNVHFNGQQRKWWQHRRSVKAKNVIISLSTCMITSQLLSHAIYELITNLYCLMSPRSTPSATKVVHATTLFSPLWSSQVTEKLLLSSFGAGFEWIRVSSCHASLDPSHEIQRPKLWEVRSKVHAPAFRFADLISLALNLELVAHEAC